MYSWTDAGAQQEAPEKLLIVTSLQGSKNESGTPPATQGLTDTLN